MYETYIPNKLALRIPEEESCTVQGCYGTPKSDWSYHSFGAQLVSFGVSINYDLFSFIFFFAPWEVSGCSVE